MTPATAARPAQQYVSDLGAFDGRLQMDDYWLHCSNYGYAYPMYGDGYSAARLPAPTSPLAGRYERAPPGYEVRTRLESADILAQHGDRQAYESLIGLAQDIYTIDATALQSGKVPTVDISVWRRLQIATAFAVTLANLAFRSDQMLGAGVVNLKSDDLGSVGDTVMDSQTAKVSYLVIARDGIFGFGKKYISLSWDVFRDALSNKLFVLASTKASMIGARQLEDDQNFQLGEFTAEMQSVKAYWLSLLLRVRA